MSARRLSIVMSSTLSGLAGPFGGSGTTGAGGGLATLAVSGVGDGFESALRLSQPAVRQAKPRVKIQRGFEDTRAD
jgi:hypothetical protein